MRTDRIAVLLNGSSEFRHLLGVERASEFLSSAGYEVVVVSPQDTVSGRDYYVEPDGFRDALEELDDRLDRHDDLFIFVTGKGRLDEDKGVGALIDGWWRYIDRHNRHYDTRDMEELFSLPYARRTVLMTQPFAAQWSDEFEGSEDTLFMAGSLSGIDNGYISDERPDFQLRDYSWEMPFFAHDWEVPDSDSDGIISWGERYAHAAGFGMASESVMVRGEAYVDEGPGGSVDASGGYGDELARADDEADGAGPGRSDFADDLWITAQMGYGALAAMDGSSDTEHGFASGVDLRWMPATGGEWCIRPGVALGYSWLASESGRHVLAGKLGVGADLSASRGVWASLTPYASPIFVGGRDDDERGRFVWGAGADLAAGVSLGPPRGWLRPGLFVKGGALFILGDADGVNANGVMGEATLGLALDF